FRPCSCSHGAGLGPPTSACPYARSRCTVARRRARRRRRPDNRCARSCSSPGAPSPEIAAARSAPALRIILARPALSNPLARRDRRRVADYNPGDANSSGVPPMQRFFDTDQHITPPPDFYAKHMPAKFKDVAPHVVDLEDGSQAWSFDGGAILHQFGLENTGGESPIGYSWAVRYDNLDPAYYDPRARVDAM